jgi:hypothetical protein
MATASRRVPIRMWLRLMLGPWLVQLSAAIIGAGSFAFAFALSHDPEDPPMPLVAGILLIGCFPLIAVGIHRGRRILYMLRRGRLDGERYQDPLGEQPDLPLSAVPDPGFIPSLFVLPACALAGVVALAIA